MRLAVSERTTIDIKNTPNTDVFYKQNEDNNRDMSVACNGSGGNGPKLFQ